MQTWELYGLRDKQEKYFQQMKSQLGFDRQRNWSEEGKTDRLLILFVGLILSSYVRHIWKSTDLHKQFSSTLEVLDELHCDGIKFNDTYVMALYIFPEPRLGRFRRLLLVQCLLTLQKEDEEKTLS